MKEHFKLFLRENPNPFVLAVGSTHLDSDCPPDLQAN